VRRRNGTELTLNEERTLLTAVELLRSGTKSFHGYPLAKAMRSGAEMNYATLYRCLDRLEKRDLLTSNWQVPAGLAQPRRIYSGTENGVNKADSITDRLCPSS